MHVKTHVSAWKIMVSVIITSISNWLLEKTELNSRISILDSLNSYIIR